MAGQPGMNIGRTRKAAEKDAIALAAIEGMLDQVAKGVVHCDECQKKLNIKDISPQQLKAAQIRYDKLRPSLAAVTQETVMHHENGSESDLVAQIRRLADANQDVKKLLLDILTAPAPVAEPIQSAAQHGDNEQNTETVDR